MNGAGAKVTEITFVGILAFYLLTNADAAVGIANAAIDLAVGATRALQGPKTAYKAK